MEIMLILLAIAGGCLLLVKIIDASGESKMGKEGWSNFKEAVHEEENKKKYNDYKISCPVCESMRVKKITNLNRASSVAVWGVASSKIGKQYECDDCHHKW